MKKIFKKLMVLLDKKQKRKMIVLIFLMLLVYACLGWDTRKKMQWNPTDIYRLSVIFSISDMKIREV